MRTLCFVLLMSFGTAAWSDTGDCRLAGTWKSDAARTLADIAARNALSPGGKNALSADFFGHMIHEWTCTEMRAWFDHQDRPDAVPYAVAENSVESLLVVFPDDPKGDLRLTFEGECYKLHVEPRGFYEYFCPVKPH